MDSIIASKYREVKYISGMFYNKKVTREKSIRK